MKETLRFVLAVLTGAVGGSIINFGLIIVGAAIIPAPAGVDVADPGSLAAAMEAGLFRPQHFIFPFIAHAGGTLAGCLIACLVLARQPRPAALTVGGLFLLGGIANAFMIPAPVWFLVLDLGLAYIPMALLALWIHQRLQQQTRSSQ